MLAQKLKTALIQFKTTADKASNLSRMATKITEAAENGAKLIVLPECWNSPYAVSAFPEYAETVPGQTSEFLSELAKKTGVFLVGGSIPEIKDGKYYNTSLSYDPAGKLIGTHRKIHLFDIDVPGKIRFMESDILSPGSQPTLLELEGYGKVGVSICYDIRFPELSAMLARQGAFALIYPGAFNMTTGPLHWQLLGRARAVDNQTYVLLCSPSRNLDSSYHAYGHSQIIDPWGKVIEEAGEKEIIIYSELEPEPLKDVQASIPVNSQRRFDIYPDVSK